MNYTVKPTFIKIFTLSAALLGYLLRFLLYATAIDQKGLIIRGHWATWSLVSLTMLFFAGLLIMAQNPKKEPDYRDCFAPSIWRTLGAFAAGGTIMVHSFRNFVISYSTIDRVAGILGIIAGIGLIISGICHLLGRKPHFLFPVAVSLYFALRLVDLYRSWSSDPQLMDYVFYLGAFICLMLCSYFLAHFHVDTRQHRSLWVAAMAAVYLSAVAIPNSGDMALLAPCAFWAFTCPPVVKHKPRRRQPAMTTHEEI